MNNSPWTQTFLNFVREVKCTNTTKELKPGDIIAVACVYLRVGEDVAEGHMGQISIDTAGEKSIPQEVYAMMCARAAQIIHEKAPITQSVPLPKTN